MVRQRTHDGGRVRSWSGSDSSGLDGGVGRHWNKTEPGGRDMDRRDEKPLAATAVVVAFVLGVSALVRAISGPHESNPAGNHPSTATPLWVLAGN